jgi:SOS-response transcriptional repressor LexA
MSNTARRTPEQFAAAQAMDRGDLTDRQRQVYEFIKDCLEAGAPPTIREVMHHLECTSSNGVLCHFKALERKGYIVRDEMKSRGIRLTGKTLREAVGDMLQCVQDEGLTARMRASIAEVRRVYQGTT